MPSEKAYRCDGPRNCQAVAASVGAFPYVLIMNPDDGVERKRARKRGFHQWSCLVAYIGAEKS